MLFLDVIDFVIAVMLFNSVVTVSFLVFDSFEFLISGLFCVFAFFCCSIVFMLFVYWLTYVFDCTVWFRCCGAVVVAALLMLVVFDWFIRLIWLELVFACVCMVFVLAFY